MRFILFMLSVAILATAGIMAADHNMRPLKDLTSIHSFKDWAVAAHWTHPTERQVVVLLDERAVEGTDATCEATLNMLDRLTRIIPASWTVKLISPTGWVPSRWNPVDRQGVEAMLRDNPTEMDDLDEDYRTTFWKRPAPMERHTFTTETSH